MDTDLNEMTKEQLITEVKRLRNGIRADLAQSRQEQCWWRPELWRLLPEYLETGPAVPSWPEFMRGCIEYRASLDQLERAGVKARHTEVAMDIKIKRRAHKPSGKEKA